MSVAALRSMFGGEPAEATAQAKGPDFLCVGLQKGGTQWLYDQLQHHPDFWMPPHKELHYFDRRFPDRRIGPVAQKFVRDPDLVNEKKQQRGDRGLDERDAAFFERVATFSARKNDVEAYAALFEPKGELLSGDITPGYSRLSNRLTKKISRRFPDAKVIMMLREPASRLWSQWRMRAENLNYSEEQQLDYALFKKFAGRKQARLRSYPTKIASRWQEHFGDRFRWFFLDDVIAKPDETRAEILAFLGADPAVPPYVPADFNRKAKPKSPERTDEIKALLKKMFESERRACARMFGGAAERWPDAPY